ncbi:MAG: HAD family phosphatase [Myxococcales bacterium]|nr:HAD family phosphatase [Myxococcales bacterium]
MACPLVFLDLDGTLIGPSADVHPALWPALDAARDAGTVLSVCTGRPAGGVAGRLAAKLGPDTPHIFHGGAGVLTGNGGLLRAEAMPVAALKALLDRARREGHTFELYTPTTLFAERDTRLYRQHQTLLGFAGRFADLAALIEREPIIKAQWVTEDDAVARQLLAELPEGCFGAIADSHAMPGAHFLTLTRQGVDKGDAARFVAARLGVDLADCAAIGDAANDLPVLEAVGHPFVMGDAPAALRQRFPTVPTVHEHGVRAALQQLSQR